MSEWRNPGGDPYIGTPTDAVQRLDAPADAKRMIISKMATHSFDDVVTVGAGYVHGSHAYAYDSTITTMNFGDGERTIATVERSTWTAEHTEQGIVYRAPGLNVVVFSVCRNVAVLHDAAPVGPAGELVFESPGAGNTPADGGLVLMPIPDRPAVFSAVAFEDRAPLVVQSPTHFTYVAPPLWVGYPGGTSMPWHGIPVAPVPEPSTTVLLLVGIVVVAGVQWLKKSHSPHR